MYNFELSLDFLLLVHTFNTVYYFVQVSSDDIDDVSDVEG